MKTLNDYMEFDHVVVVHDDGSVTDAEGVYAPELYGDELMSDQWSLLDGFSGQHGYSGPLMHQSEYIGGGMERYILENPGTYVALVSVDPDGDDPTEWAVAVLNS